MRADATVVGAGPAGCAAAIGLARSGARVVLFRRSRALSCRPGEIVEPTFRVPLSELGLDGTLSGVGALALAGNLSRWESEEVVKADGMLNPYGLGALLDRADFEEWMVSAAISCGVTVLHVDSRPHLSKVDGKWQLVGGGLHLRPVSAPLLIQATGRGKRLFGPGEREPVDQLVALLMYGDARDGPADQRLLIEAGHQGWWYAAPLPGNRAVAAFMTDLDLLPRTAEARTAFFRAELRATRLIAPFAASMRTRSPIIGYPAESAIRRTIHGEGWVSIGDAAATYDPLSGCGVPAALAKGTAVARLILTGGDAARAFADYEAAERSAFADFHQAQRRNYRRAAVRFNSDFWLRRRA